LGEKPSGSWFGELEEKGPSMKKSKRRVPYLSHGAEGRVELGERMVDDPLEAGQRYQAQVNVRESSIDHMHSRGRIDASQKLAGDRFRKLWEMAAVGQNKAMDTSKEPVDGGGIGDPFTDDLIRASQELSRVMRELGPVGSKMMVALVGEGQRVEDVASHWSQAGGALSGRRAEGYVSGRMIEALDDLVRLWKLESAPIIPNETKSYRRNGELVSVQDDIRSSSDGWTGPVTEVSVGRFGDIVETQKRGLDRGPLMNHSAANGK
jgi:hypothetical protein